MLLESLPMTWKSERGAEAGKRPGGTLKPPPHNTRSCGRGGLHGQTLLPSDGLCPVRLGLKVLPADPGWTTSPLPRGMQWPVVGRRLRGPDWSSLHPVAWEPGAGGRVSSAEPGPRPGWPEGGGPVPGRQGHAGGGPGADAVRGGPGSRRAKFPAPPGGAGGGHVTLGAARGPEIAAAVDPPAGGAREGGDRRSRLAGRGACRPRRMRSPCPARPRAHDGHPRAQSVSSWGESCAPGAACPPTPSVLLVTLLPAPSSSPLPRAP